MPEFKQFCFHHYVCVSYKNSTDTSTDNLVIILLSKISGFFQILVLFYL